MIKSLDVVAVGTLNVDLIIIGDAPRDIEALNQWAAVSQVELTAAGSVGYCAIDMARLGLSVSMLSSVADDVFGHWILGRLADEGINTEAVTMEKGHSSGIGIYMLLFGNNKRPLTARLATHTPWPVELSPVAEERLRNARLLHCGGYLHYSQMWGTPSENLYRKAKEFGLITSVDTQFPITQVEGRWMKCFGNLLKYVDLLFTDEHEAQSITGASSPDDAATQLLREGPRLVIIKQGSQGAILATKEKTIRQPAYPMKKIVDPIGAGDAFDAGVIYGALQGFDLEHTANFASIAAALTLRGVGGTQTAPTASEVKALLGKV